MTLLQSSSPEAVCTQAGTHKLRFNIYNSTTTRDGMGSRWETEDSVQIVPAVYTSQFIGFLGR